MPTLPLQPEPLDQLQARVPAALDRVFVAGNTDPDRPGTQRRQVFDTEDGLRFIISREYEAVQRLTMLHVSISFAEPPPPADESIDERGRVLLYLLGQVATLFKGVRRVEEDGMVLQYLEISPGGVVHFIYDDIPHKRATKPTGHRSGRQTNDHSGDSAAPAR